MWRMRHENKFEFTGKHNCMSSVKLWGDENILVLVEAMFLHVPLLIYQLLPGQTLELTRNVDSITFAYPFTSSLYFFLSLLKCFLNVALSLWLNMHSKHSAMQNIMTDCLFERQTVVPDDYSALGLHYCLVNG